MRRITHSLDRAPRFYISGILKRGSSSPEVTPDPYRRWLARGGGRLRFVVWSAKKDERKIRRHAPEAKVTIVAIGIKERDRVRIGGETIKL